MELRHLRYFAALAEQLNFTRAAETVHVTQSTLSHQIKQLETEIGHRLFDRIGKRIVITEAGEQLLGRVKHALSEIDGGLRAVRGSAQQLSGNLRIGVTHTFNVSLLPACIDIFFGKHPSVRVTVQELNAESVARGVEAGTSTSASPTVPTARRRSRSSRCATTRWHRWSRLGIRWRVESAFAWSSCTARSSCSRPAIPPRASCSKAGFARSAEPVVVVEMNPIASALALVRRIEAGAIISRQALTETADLHVIPIENPTPMRTPGILWHRDHQPTAAAKSFAVVLRNTVIGTRMVERAREREWSAPGWNDRQQHVEALGAEMNRRPAAEDRRRPVVRIVVKKRTAARELVLHVGEAAAARALVDVVLAAHRQADAIARRDDDAGRPDSTSSSTTSPGASGQSSSWVWYGR